MFLYFIPPPHGGGDSICGRELIVKAMSTFNINVQGWPAMAGVARGHVPQSSHMPCTSNQAKIIWLAFVCISPAAAWYFDLV